MRKLRWQRRCRSGALVGNEIGASPVIEYSMFAILITFVCIIAASLMFEKVRDVFTIVPGAIHSST